MPQEFVARNGIIALNNSIVTGSLTVTQGITGSLFGTASWSTNTLSSSYILSAVSASFASTASNVLGGAANYIPLWNTATSLSSSVIYQSGGNVGIGTTSPSARLQVEARSDSDIELLRLYRVNVAGSDDHQLQIYADVTNNIIRYNSTGNNIGGHAWFNSGTERMRITPGGEILIAGTYNPLAASGRGNVTLNGTTDNILAFTNNTTTTGYIFHGGTEMQIYNAANGNMRFFTNSLERARITSGGDVGIGTTSPNAKLDVNGDTIVTGSITSTNTVTTLNLAVNGTNATFNSTNTTINSTNIIVGNDATDIVNIGNSTIYLPGTGNIGIGKSTANAKLDVSGSAIVSGSFTVAPSNAVELQVTSTGVRVGNVITDVHTVTGSLNVSGSSIISGSLSVTQGITGSLQGTASFAVTASHALNGGGEVAEPIPAGAKLYLFYNY